MSYMRQKGPFYPIAMKPTVPDTGTVLRLEGDAAVVLLEGGKSCKGCGAARIGLCRAAGNSMIVTVDNSVAALPGDKVQIGIDRKVKIKGYLFAYIIPLFSFISGAMTGHFLGGYIRIPSLDVLTGFVALALISGYTFSRLRRLDCTYRMTVKKVISDQIFRTEVKSDEERRYEGYAADH